MLLLLTDENMSPVVAVQVSLKRPDIVIQSIHRWRNGALLGTADRTLIENAQAESLTLITYDQKTIPPLLLEMASASVGHSGIIFVDESTIASQDVGGLVKAIIALWDRCSAWDWTDRISFLDAAKE